MNVYIRDFKKCKLYSIDELDLIGRRNAYKGFLASLEGFNEEIEVFTYREFIKLCRESKMSFYSNGEYVQI